MPRLLAGYRRLLKPGGLVRLTEAELALTTGQALERFQALCCEALKKAGQCFSVDGRHVGITPALPRLVRQTGFVHVQVHASAVKWSMGTEAHHSAFQDYLMLLELIKPFLIKMGEASQDELRLLGQQAFAKMQQKRCCALYTLLTVWDYRPSSQKDR